MMFCSVLNFMSKALVSAEVAGTSASCMDKVAQPTDCQNPVRLHIISPRKHLCYPLHQARVRHTKVSLLGRWMLASLVSVYFEKAKSRRWRDGADRLFSRVLPLCAGCRLILRRSDRGIRCVVGGHFCGR